MGRCSGKPQFLLCLKLDKTSCSLHPPWKLQRKIFHQEHALGFERSQHYLIRRCLLSGYWCLGSILQDWSFPSTSSSSRIIFWAEFQPQLLLFREALTKVSGRLSYTRITTYALVYFHLIVQTEFFVHFFRCTIKDIVKKRL